MPHPPASSSPWTPVRVLLLLLVVLNVIGFVVWAILNPDRYATAKAVIAGVWAGMLALLGFLKVKAPRETRFVELIGSRPMAAVILLVTVLGAGAALSYAPLRPYELVLGAGIPFAEIEILKPGGITETRQLTAGEPIRLQGPPGEYRVRAARAGFLEQVAHLDLPLLRLGTVRHEIVMEPKPGYLALIPEGSAALTIQAYGAASHTAAIPPQRLLAPALWTLPPGEYVVTASAPGYREGVYRVELRPDVKTALPIDLATLPAPTGVLRVDVLPPDAQIIHFGHRILGRSPADIRLSPGEYRLLLRHRGGEEYGNQRTVTVTVPTGDTATVTGLLDAVSMATLIIRRAPDRRGSYYAIEAATGDEITVGPADRDVTVRVFPGAFQLFRRVDGQEVRGPGVDLGSADVHEAAGF